MSNEHSRVRVGVVLEPQNTTYSSYAQAACRFEEIGVDSLWDWDHFFPPYGQHKGGHFEGWTLLAAMAAVTSRAEIGCLVTCNGYRNPALLSSMARTVDHVSGGRLILGLGAGWLEYEYKEYGYPFGTARSRLDSLAEALPLIKKRWQVDEPRPVRDPIPILVGGEGEQVTLKLAAQYADLWNGFGPADHYRHKNEVLDRWCREIGRNPAEIERTVVVEDTSPAALDELRAAGASHMIVELEDPWDYARAEDLVRWREMQ